MSNTSTANGFRLARNPLGRLDYTAADGTLHEGVVPVRAFPIAAPSAGISIVSTEGKELAWIDQLDQLPPHERALVNDELASREFVPVIHKLLHVSTYSTPSTWDLETDRGPTQLVLKGEEDIRRLPGNRASLLITSGHGVVFLVRDLLTMDKHSKKLLERFL
ncbi:MAG: DUF1854 domain-containing protein [Burkholderiales bacterium]|nr:DUF1854 domain-containing protein [Burkholderiales bacterium]